MPSWEMESTAWRVVKSGMKAAHLLHVNWFSQAKAALSVVMGTENSQITTQRHLVEVPREKHKEIKHTS